MPQYGCFIHAASPEICQFHIVSWYKKPALVRWVATQEANYSKNENEGAQTIYANDLGQVTHGHIFYGTDPIDCFHTVCAGSCIHVDQDSHHLLVMLFHLPLNPGTNSRMQHSSAPIPTVF